jgi:transposase
MTNDDTTKAAAIYLLKQGLGISDVARLAGRSRQIVAHWAKGLPHTRAEYLARQWAKATKNQLRMDR